MPVDIIISTRNNVRERSFSLSYVIRALLHQKSEALNIIVADNGSDDGTSDELRRMFGQKIGIIDTTEQAGNIAASKNAAVACGKAEIIFFLDDDMIADGPDTIAKCVKIGSSVDFACGALRMWAPITWPEIVRSDDPINKMMSTLSQVAYEPHSVNRISGKNIIDNRSYLANFGTISRRVFEEVGGFDENYVGFGYQDTDLMYRLCKGRFEYDLFINHGVRVFHLAHKVDKSEHYENNRARFVEKQRLDGRQFHTNHFFEIYESDGYSLFSDFPASNIS